MFLYMLLSSDDADPIKVLVSYEYYAKMVHYLTRFSLERVITYAIKKLSFDNSF